jgi:hypothetical protein
MDPESLAASLVPPSHRSAIFACEDIKRLLSGGFASVADDGRLLVNPSVHQRPKLGYVHQMRLAGLGSDWALLRTDAPFAVGCVLHRLPNHPWMWRTDGRIWALPKGRMPIATAQALSRLGEEAGPIHPLWDLPTIDPARAREKGGHVVAAALQGFYALHDLTGIVQVSLPRVVRTYAGPTWSPVGTRLPSQQQVSVADTERLGTVLAHLLRQAGLGLDTFASTGCGGSSDRNVLFNVRPGYVDPNAARSAHARLPWIRHWKDAEAALDGALSCT